MCKLPFVFFMCRYLNMLLLPGAYGHGLLRCSLYQVSVSAVLHSINNEDLCQMTEAVLICHYYYS